MKLLIDISFKSEDSLLKALDFIQSKCSVSKIEYQLNYKWENLESISHLETNGFEQAKIEFKSGAHAQLQRFKTSLPRLFFNSIEKSEAASVFSFIENELTNDIEYAMCLESIDGILQNAESVGSWRRKKRQMPSNISIIPNPIYTNDQDTQIVNIESLAGHFHIMNYGEMLWFGSCWQMYFSSIYYKYIPKILFDEFCDCYENVVLENGLRRIILFKNIEDFNDESSRLKQWSFRRSLGIDSIAHELVKANNRIEPENLPVVITKRNCVKGQTRVIRFLDENGALVGSHVAVKKEIKEYLDDGITIVFEDILNI